MTQHSVDHNTVHKPLTMPAPTRQQSRQDCEPSLAVTRSLLGYGVVAGVTYEVTSVVQGATRPGFDFARHSWSLLSNGSLGWIQITNFIVAGAMTIAFALGLARALRVGPGARWAPRLVGGYGICLIGAGAFHADPALGFPEGTPKDAHDVSWHGMLHLAFGGIGFLCLVAACVVIARRFVAEGRHAWAWYSLATGALFLVGFAGVASGATVAWATLGFVAAVTIAWIWIAALAVHLYRRLATSVAH